MLQGTRKKTLYLQIRTSFVDLPRDQAIRYVAVTPLLLKRTLYLQIRTPSVELTWGPC